MKRKGMKTGVAFAFAACLGLATGRGVTRNTVNEVYWSTYVEETTEMFNDDETRQKARSILELLE